MRPVNLIPPEDRRGDRAPLRTGVAPYAVVAVLLAAVVGVAALVLTGNQISDRETELATLEAREAEAAARAEALSPYAEFASLSQARNATVSSLAQSRFDWERVLRELALVIPDDIWLTAMSGTAAGEEASETSGSTANEDISGRSLTMTGCGTGHEAVAAFLQALKDIDGVTRVGIMSSELPSEDETSTASSGSESASEGDCQTRKFISQFEILVAFDGAPAAAAPATSVPGATAPAPEASDGQVQQSQAASSAEEQSDAAQNAATIVPGVAK